MCVHVIVSVFSWNNLRELVEAKRDEIDSAHGLQNFHIECNETIVRHLNTLYSLINIMTVECLKGLSAKLYNIYSGIQQL